MAKLERCFKIHLNIDDISDFDVFINSIAKIADLMLDKDKIFVWLDDDKTKKNLISLLKKNNINEFFCEPIEYETIGKDKDFNFISAWFMDNYTAYSYRKAERENQDRLREMYNNIQKAQAELENKNRGEGDLDDKQNYVKEAL